MGKNVYWTPWVEETKAVVNRYARYLFASLILTFLVLANLAMILVIVASLKRLLG